MALSTQGDSMDNALQRLRSRPKSLIKPLQRLSMLYTQVVDCNTPRHFEVWREDRLSFLALVDNVK